MTNRQVDFIRCFTFALFMLLFFASSAVFTARCFAQPGTGVKAFFLDDLPADHEKIHKLFVSLKDAGADTVVAGPLAGRGPLTLTTLPNVVFLAHQARLKLFVIVPTRADEEALASHPEWEDRRYDLQSGTLQPAGKLDLSHPDVVTHVMMTGKNVASFFVDGIILGDDFSYADTEGMSHGLLEAYKQRFQRELAPGKAFAKIEKVNESYRVGEYGEGYQNLVRMRRERLVDVLKALIAASRTVNRDVKFAVPLRLQEFEKQLDALPEYEQDINAFKSVDPDYFWLAFPNRESEGLNYKKGMETVARTALVISMAVKEPSRTILVLPMTNPSGRLLSYTEIEEATEMARKGGKPCIAYRVRKDTVLPVTLTKKLFKEQQAN